MPEILDLYTREGVNTGRTILRGEDSPDGLLWPVCSVWLLRSDGRLLIQKRSMNKPLFPGRWCCSAGGCVQHGETPLEGALRETREELGLALDPACGRLLFIVPSVRSIHQVWLFRMDTVEQDLTLQAEEVDAVRYVTPQELLDLVASEQFVRINYLDRLLPLL